MQHHKQFRSRSLNGNLGADDELHEVRQRIATGDWNYGPPEYKAVRNELTVLRKLVVRGTRIVISKLLKKHTTGLAHEGHQGIVKTKARLRTKVWWPGIDRQTEQACKTCHECQLVCQPTPPEPDVIRSYLQLHG